MFTKFAVVFFVYTLIFAQGQAATPQIQPNSSTAISHQRIETRSVQNGAGTARELWFVDDGASPKIEAKLGVTETIPLGVPSYHWGPEQMRSWAEQGFPDTKEMRERTRLQDGYYVSSDITDSANYGPLLVVQSASRRPIQIAVVESATTMDITSAHPELYKFFITKNINARIQEMGFDGIRFEKTWYRFFNPNAAFTYHLASSDDFIQSERFKKGQMTLDDFLMMDQRYTLKDTPQLEAQYPIIHKVLVGQELTAKEEKEFVTQFAASWWNSYSKQPVGPVGRSIARKYSAQILQAIVETKPTNASSLLQRLGIQAGNSPSDVPHRSSDSNCGQLLDATVHGP